MNEAKWPSHVLVPLDGTAPSASVFPVAEQLARISRAPLHVLRVFTRHGPPDVSDQLGLTPEQVQGTIVEKAEGDAADGILAVAAGLKDVLIVMAMHGAVRPAGGMGSVAVKVVRSAACPVLIAHPGPHLWHWQFRRLLLPLNGSPDSASCICPAIRLMQLAGASASIVHVSAAARPAKAPGTLTTPRYVDQPQHEWPNWISEFLDRARYLCGIPKHVKLKFRMAKGDPAAEILRVAREEQSDLLVTSWKKVFELGRAATLKSIIRDAPCPVLILPIVS